MKCCVPRDLRKHYGLSTLCLLALSDCLCERDYEGNLAPSVLNMVKHHVIWGDLLKLAGMEDVHCGPLSVVSLEFGVFAFLLET